MFPIACPICYEIYSLNRIPKVTECGHSFCSVCLQSIFEADKKCPTCKISFLFNLEQYPSNLIVLRMNTIEKHKELSKSLNELEKELEYKKEFLLNSINTRKALIGVVDKNLKQIRKFIEMDENNFQSVYAGEFILKVVQHLPSIDTELRTCLPMDIKPIYSLSSYLNPSHFILDLADRLRKGEKFYSCEIVENKRKIGPIKLLDNKIIVHALDTDNTDYNLPIILFSDLRKCTAKNNFRVFLKFETENEFVQFLTLDIVDSSILASRFIKLCTGEIGPMFKGIDNLVLQKHSLLSNPRETLADFFLVEKSMFPDTVGGETIFNDYNMITVSPKAVVAAKDEIIVHMFHDGMCKIQKCLVDGLLCENVVAKVVDPIGFNISNIIFKQGITDSGIIFLL